MAILLHSADCPTPTARFAVGLSSYLGCTAQETQPVHNVILHWPSLRIAVFLARARVPCNYFEFLD